MAQQGQDEATAKADALRRLIIERASLIRLFFMARGKLGYTALWLGSLLVTLLYPPLLALAVGALIGGAPGDFLFLLGTLVVIAQITEVLTQPLQIAVGRSIDGAVRARIRSLMIHSLSIETVTRPDIVADIARACNPGVSSRQRTPGMAAVGQVVLMSRILAAVVSAAIVMTVAPLLGLVVFTLGLAMRSAVRRQWIGLARVTDAQVLPRLKLDYLTEMATSPFASKEVRTFNASSWLIRRWRVALHSYSAPSRSFLKHILSKQGVLLTLSIFAAAAAMATPALMVWLGTLTIAQAAQTITACLAVLAIAPMGHEAFDIDYGVNGLRALRRLEAELAPMQDHSEAEWAPIDRAEAEHGVADTLITPMLVKLRDVSFTYPQRTSPSLANVNLDIAAGEVLAITGLNGSGKSTLTQVLSGLYKTSGEFSVNGNPIDDVRSSWQRSVGVLRQDFIRYPASLLDNVTLGAAEVTPNRQMVQFALERAGLGGLTRELGAGLDTVLSPDSRGGTELSGGQWQRVAIARELYAALHGRKLLIFDEPTASLDIEAENGFFEDVVSAIQGPAVVLISHRLATLRRADRIVFLKDGAVAESGSHDQLMQLGGEYSFLYASQAKRFGVMG